MCILSDTSFFTELTQLWRFRRNKLYALSGYANTSLSPRGCFVNVCYLPATARLQFDWFRIRPHSSHHLVGHHCVWTSCTALPKIGSLLVNRLGRRLNSSASLGQCFVCDSHHLWHPSFNRADPLTFPPLLLRCRQVCHWEVWQDGKQSAGLPIIESDHWSWIISPSNLKKWIYSRLGYCY